MAANTKPLVAMDGKCFTKKETNKEKLTAILKANKFEEIEKNHKRQQLMGLIYLLDS